jgi:uncharacterized membrane protein YfcA
VFVGAVLGGAIAAVSGFGIGSMLTPLLAVRFGTKLAVAIVSAPHLIATAARFISLKQHVDRRVLLNFGLLSAAGGLCGALLNSRAASQALTIVFGVLLLFAGVSGLSGFAQRMRFGNRTAWVAGAASGFFGGLVGNQGGIRSAALLGFSIPKESFVATATAIALLVDAARMPVYVATQARDMFSAWPSMLIAICGALIGTFGGVRILRRMPEHWFNKSVAALIALLGVYMLLKGVGAVQ